MSGRILLIVAAGLVSGGCAVRARAGYSESLTDPGTQSGGVALSVHRDLVGVVGVSARSTLGPNLQSGAVGVEAGFPMLPDVLGPISPSIYGGVHLAQVDRADEQLSFGVGSPYLQAGLGTCAEDLRWTDNVQCLGLFVDLEHHVRFNQPDETFLGLSLNYTVHVRSLPAP